MQNHKFLVIGLGRFGSSLALTLKDLKCHVVGIDTDQSLVDEFSEKLNQTLCCDSTDEFVLQDIDVHKFDVVVIAIGTNVQASVMTAVLLKDMKVKRVVAKALSDTHGILLHKIGVDRVVFPEREAGARLANQLVSPNLLELIELSSKYRVAEVSIPKRLDGYTLAKINAGGKYNVNIVAINRFLDSNELIIAPKAECALRENDRVVLIGEFANIDRFEREVIDRD